MAPVRARGPPRMRAPTGARCPPEASRPQEMLWRPSAGHQVAPRPMADSSPSSALSPERYLAWLYSPPEQQSVLAALCQIEAEIAGSLKPGIDHHVAHTRLQWWREECERTAQGRPVHPLTRELVRAYGGEGNAGTSPIARITGFV